MASKILSLFVFRRGQVLSAKAPEDWRSPKAVANSEGSMRREASWTAPVFWRFLTGAVALNIYACPRISENGADQHADKAVRAPLSIRHTFAFARSSSLA